MSDWYYPVVGTLIAIKLIVILIWLYYRNKRMKEQRIERERLQRQLYEQHRQQQQEQQGWQGQQQIWSTEQQNLAASPPPPYWSAVGNQASNPDFNSQQDENPTRPSAWGRKV